MSGADTVGRRWQYDDLLRIYDDNWQQYDRHYLRADQAVQPVGVGVAHQYRFGRYGHSDSRNGMVSGGIDAKLGVRKFGNPEFLPIFVMSGAQPDRPGRFCFFSDSFPLSQDSGVYPAAFRNLWA